MWENCLFLTTTTKQSAFTLVARALSQFPTTKNHDQMHSSCFSTPEVRPYSTYYIKADPKSNIAGLKFYGILR